MSSISEENAKNSAINTIIKKISVFELPRIKQKQNIYNMRERLTISFTNTTEGRGVGQSADSQFTKHTIYYISQLPSGNKRIKINFYFQNGKHSLFTYYHICAVFAGIYIFLILYTHIVQKCREFRSNFGQTKANTIFIR